jgi:hypothetical protein
MLGILLLVLAGIMYFRIGDHEYGAGFVTAGLSVITSIVTWLVFGWGPVGFLVGQVALFAGLTVYNVKRHERQQRGFLADPPVRTSYPKPDPRNGD